MRDFGPLGATILSSLLLVAPALAQQSAPAAGQDKGAQTVPAPQPTPGAANPEPAPAPAPAPGSENAATAAAPSARPDLVVATVKLEQGWRATKLIGSDVFNEKNQKIGSIDDLIVMPNEQISYAIVSVGGFLGMGNKLVAIPYAQLRLTATKDNARRIELAGAPKASLEAMPGFTYSKR